MTTKTTTTLTVSTVEQLKDLLNLLKPFGIKRLSVPGLDLEFDPVTAAVVNDPNPTSLDAAEDLEGRVKLDLEELLKEQQEIADWSR